MLFGLAVFAALIVGLYYLISFYLSSNNSYWPKRGVSLVTPTQAATIWELLTKKKTLVGVDDEYYKIFKERGVKYGGIMEFRKPTLFIMDLDLIKQVCVKDFDHFVDRRPIMIHEPVIENMLTSLEGQQWKDVRSILSPTFTTGKIKRMFQHFNSCGKNILTYVTKTKVPSSGDKDGSYTVTIQDVVSRYTVDVIGATAFGMDTGALKDSQSIFYKMAKRAQQFEYLRMMRWFMYFSLPKLANYLKLEVTNESWKFFTEILRKALKERQESKEKRDDFLQLIIEASKGELASEEGDATEDAFEKDAQLNNSKSSKITLNDDMAISQCVLFFVVGFDTVSSLVNFAAYLMAIHQDIQERVSEEVEKNIDEKTGNIEYDSFGKMEYLDKFVSGEQP